MARTRKDKNASKAARDKYRAEDFPLLTSIPFRPQKTPFSLSIALPTSIVTLPKSDVLRAHLVATVARFASIFGVDNILLYTDTLDAAAGDPAARMAYLAKNLQYLNTPQYLRKLLYPICRDLKFAGCQPPIDAPHHLRQYELLPWREAARAAQSPQCPVHGPEGTYLEAGLTELAYVSISVPQEHEVTIQWSSESLKRLRGRKSRPEKASCACGALSATVVKKNDVARNHRIWWGYKVELMDSLAQVCAPGRFDCIVGTSEKGEPFDAQTMNKYRKMDTLIVFGPQNGLESVADAQSLDIDAFANLFSHYVNFCPHQRSRTIRTEEAVPIVLTQWANAMRSAKRGAPRSY